MCERVKIISLSEQNEYYVKVLVNDIYLEAMIISAPYSIREGEIYKAEFSFFNTRDCILRETNSIEKSIKYKTNYSYIINGILMNNNTVDANIKISSDFLMSNADLIGKCVNFEIDRLEISFIL